MPDPPKRHRHTRRKDGWEQEGVVRVRLYLRELMLASPVPRYYEHVNMGRGQNKVYSTHDWA